MKKLFPVVSVVLSTFPLPAQPSETLLDTPVLTWQGDLSARMVEGIHRFLARKTQQMVPAREQYWQRDFSSLQGYAESVAPNRQRFRTIIGAVDPRLPARLERVAGWGEGLPVAQTPQYTIWEVRWPVLEGVWGEGLLLEPARPPLGHVIALSDANHTPEQLVGLASGIPLPSQFARCLAESGLQVLVPTLINRSSQFSGNPRLRTDRPTLTNMPHREWLYRMAYEMGRHLIGYEVQKVMAAVDWIRQNQNPDTRIAVAGYGEGGLIAFYAAAVDPRIDSCLVSGYFAPREELWKEPIYRNVWGILREFGDAEIASLIFPRALIVEHSPFPQVFGRPPAAPNQKAVAAPGEISTPALEQVRREFERVLQWQRKFPVPVPAPRLVFGEGPEGTVPFGSDEALQALLESLGVPGSDLSRIAEGMAWEGRRSFDPDERQRRQVRQIEEHVQDLLRISKDLREEFFLRRVPYDSAQDFARAAADYRRIFWEEVIGKVDDPLEEPRPRTRKVYDRPSWSGYEVVLDVWPDVFAWGILLLPKDLKPGERRPVVVTQHGLEGLPADVIEEESRSYRAYRAYAARLAERGFIVYAPHNPYRGEDQFRLLQFRANPLKLSLFSFIVGQHRQLLDWLKTLPFVDGQRIGFYGLSYGGKTAMRVPAILEDYALSICSADFNEWIWKNVTVDWPNSYMFTKEYEMYEFNLGMTFNYAEMAYLIFPRPFMVERGHRDGVGLDEWVAFEYAKVRRLYNELGHGEKTEIEFFNGGHEIHGQGTFDFLHRHLGWPNRHLEESPPPD